MTETQSDSARAELRLSRPTADTLCLELSGRWTLQAALPEVDSVLANLTPAGPVRHLSFDSRALEDWDSGLLTFLLKLHAACGRANVELDRSELPEGARRLLALATAVPERGGARREEALQPLLARIGTATLAVNAQAVDLLGFLGQTVIAFGKLLRGTARFRRSDLALVIQECGADALPIVSLISVLVGLILAFIGAVQLQQFGAEIYVANLVGVGMARQMGAMMTAIIMAGRTGAAFAAQLGTMTVNEEIDALTTLGIPPIEYLVLPRMLALVMMMPLLSLYADLLGMLGGFIVGVSILGIAPAEYLNQTQSAMRLADFGVGLVYAAVFGVLIALAGCMRGMQCGRSASAVGQAATSAVVTGIVLIIVSDAVLTVVFNTLGI